MLLLLIDCREDVRGACGRAPWTLASAAGDVFCSGRVLGVSDGLRSDDESSWLRSSSSTSGMADRGSCSSPSKSLPDGLEPLGDPFRRLPFDLAVEGALTASPG